MHFQEIYSPDFFLGNPLIPHFVHISCSIEIIQDTGKTRVKQIFARAKYVFYYLVSVWLNILLSMSLLKLAHTTTTIFNVCIVVF